MRHDFSVPFSLVLDPKDYRWCGYGEALAGKKKARTGLATALGDAGQSEWRKIAARYRLLVCAFGEESGLREDGAPLPEVPPAISEFLTPQPL